MKLANMRRILGNVLLNNFQARFSNCWLAKSKLADFTVDSRQFPCQ